MLQERQQQRRRVSGRAVAITGLILWVAGIVLLSVLQTRGVPVAQMPLLSSPVLIGQALVVAGGLIGAVRWLRAAKSR